MSNITYTVLQSYRSYRKATLVA